MVSPYVYVTVPALLLGTSEQERLARVAAAQVSRLARIANPPVTAPPDLVRRLTTCRRPRVTKVPANVGRTFGRTGAPE